MRIACIIPGAGAGSRFGEPKAGALVAPGVRFLDAIVAAASAAGVDDIVAVLPPGIDAPAGVRTVVNPRPESEQIESVRRALAQLVNVPVTGALIWPVDHPLVASATAAQILETVRERSPLCAVPVVNGRRGHPVYFSRDVWRELATVSDGGARAVLRAHAADTLEIIVGDAAILHNIDTREDLTRGLEGMRNA